jgi:outer membrane protein OmpA-like peptidoglycan-associated protein
MPAGTAADAQAAGGAGAAAGAQATGDAAAADQTAATMAAEEQAAAEANAATEAAAQLQALMPGADAASGDTQAQPQDVQTETVTEENSRSSGEEFDSQIQATAAANETGTTATEDKKGLTDLEKALVLGAGALAVGQLLGNNRQVVTSSNDRVVVSRGDGSYEIIKDDNALLRQPGSQVQTETFSDGSTRTTVTRDDGTKIVTIRDPQLRVVRRVRVDTNGDQVVLIDDTAQVQPVNVTELPRPETRTVDIAQMQDTEDALRQALEQRATYDRNFSLSQIRDIPQVRALAPAIDLDNVTFETGSAAIQPDQADHLATLGRTIKDIIAQNPREVFLVEGHTDAVGDAAYNLALSDRRAESVALALSEYFGVPAENLVVQGYGERFLKVPTEGAERANRRATVRRITPLLQTAAVQ